MPYRLRADYPGAWHHVFNRGIAKRTLFETSRDFRYFRAQLAREVRAGRLEVHAYAIMVTHFHLLVRSPSGKLPEAMQRAQDAYARWFNRRRHRDGPLFRGRYGNRIIESDAYLLCLLRYIDDNPVKAGVCAKPWDYAHGSARWYLRRKGPPWLSRDVVETAAGRRTGDPWDPRLYEQLSSVPITEGERWIAERRALEAAPEERDPLDDVLGGGAPGVLAWMERKARLADGTRPGHVLVSPDSLLRVAGERKMEEPGRVLRVAKRPWPLWEVLEAGSLRDYAGLGLLELEARMALSRGTLQSRLRMHVRAMDRSLLYREEVAQVLACTLRLDFPRGSFAVRASRVIVGGDGGSEANEVLDGPEPGGSPAPGIP